MKKQISSPQIQFYLDMINDGWRRKFYRDALYMPWRSVSMLDISSKGRYVFPYENLDLQRVLPNEWHTK